MADFHKAFEAIDEDGSGEITVDELQHYMIKNNYKASFVSKWLTLFDGDKSGKITYEHYCETLGLVPNEREPLEGRKDAAREETIRESRTAGEAVQPPKRKEEAIKTKGEATQPSQTVRPAKTTDAKTKPIADSEDALKSAPVKNKVNINNTPPYGMRNGWVSRKPEDFGDGGAFPEIHVPQYPLDISLIDDTYALVVTKNVDEDSNVDIIFNMVEVPMEPPKFKIPKRNPRGYTVPLANRDAADGRNNQVKDTNENINSFLEALLIPERKCREVIGQRNSLHPTLNQKEQDNSYSKLHQYVLQLREKQKNHWNEDSLEAKERDEIRRERERNNAGPDVRRRAVEERDISGHIALGPANPLFNRLKADKRNPRLDRMLMDKIGRLDMGFAAGADDLYDIYDKPLFNQNKAAYKAPRVTDWSAIEDIEKELVKELVKIRNRFSDQNGKEFLSEKEAQDAPVAFELNMLWPAEDTSRQTAVSSSTEKK